VVLHDESTDTERNDENEKELHDITLWVRWA
jgi:hypothetical protein